MAGEFSLASSSGLDLERMLVVSVKDSVPQVFEIEQDYTVSHNLINVLKLMAQQVLGNILGCRRQQDEWVKHDAIDPGLSKPFNIATNVDCGSPPVLVYDLDLHQMPSHEYAARVIVAESSMVASSYDSSTSNVIVRSPSPLTAS